MTSRADIKTWHYNVIISVIAALLFIPFLGGVHLFDWDEINFAESAREMITSGDYLTVQINFIPFWEKPPLFIWMQVLSMKVFGINEFAARFPNAICGIVSLLVLFNTGRRITGTRFGLYWVLFYAGSMLPFFYFKSGIIDPWFNLYIFLGIYQFYLYCSTPENKMLHSTASAFFVGLAVLTKGPVAFLIFVLTAGIFFIYKRFRITVRLSDIAVYLLVLSFTGGFWFILQILKGNFSIIADFIIYQIRLFRTEDAGHGGFFLYHFVVLFIGVFPASIFALPALFGSKMKPGPDKDFYIWMLILFWAVLVLFTIVKTKIVHYSSLCYFPLTFIGAWVIYRNDEIAPAFKKVIRILIGFIGILLSILVTSLTFFDHFKNFIIEHNWINDPFTIGCIMADGEWKGFEFLAGILLLSAIVTFLIIWKKGNYSKSCLLLAGVIPIFMMVALSTIVPRVEAYSQQAAVEFFNSVSDQDAYLETIGYKSYVHLFYGKVKNHVNTSSKDEVWLLTGNIDKNAYFSVKLNKKYKFMQQYPEMRFLYEKNGFVFFTRTPKSTK